MTAQDSTAAVLKPWIHVALWFVTVLLALVFSMTGAAALVAMATGAPPPSDANLLYLSSSGLLLIVLVAAWRRSWFTASDVVRLLRSRGATGFERRRLSPRQVKARVDDLWVIACLDRAALSY